VSRRFKPDAEEPCYSYLTGHYCGMLEELIDLIGASEIMRIIDARLEIQRMRERLEEERDELKS
jgi:hypothetical protein